MTMKPWIRTSFFLFIVGILVGVACIRDEVLDNKAPRANAGPNQYIYLPTNSTILDGSKSLDQENNITSYMWRNIAGPSSFVIMTDHAVKTGVVNLVLGSYWFELMVTDKGGLFSKDTVLVDVLAPPPPPPPCDNLIRPEINARLLPLGKLSSEREGMAMASAGDLILFAGGKRYGIPQVWNPSRVDIYNTSTKTWTTSELSTGRHGIAAVSSGNKIFFAGGQRFDGADDEILSTVDIYDVVTNTWSVTSLSEPRGFLAAATVGNKVLFAGGVINWDYSTSVKVDIYDLVTNHWSTALLSEPRANISAVASNDKIYFAGGQTKDRWPSLTIDIYDGKTQSWSTSGLKKEMGLLAGINVGDKIYWAEGCTVEVKDVNTGNSSVANLFQQASWSGTDGQNLAIRDNKIIFYTNYWYDSNISLERSNKFDIYDITTNTWSIGVLPQKLSGFSILSVDNIIYVAGGYTNSSLSNQVWTLEF